MKLAKLRGTLRQAELDQPVVYRRQTGDDDPNCPECNGSGLSAWGVEHLKDPDVPRLPCKVCGGSGFKLEGTKAPRQHKDKKERASWLADDFVSRMMGGSLKWTDAKASMLLVAAVPDPAAAHLLDLDQETILTNPVLLTGARTDGRVAKADAVTFVPKSFKRVGVIQAAVLIDSDAKLLAVVELTKGGAGVLYDGFADFTVTWDDSAGLFEI